MNGRWAGGSGGPLGTSVRRAIRAVGLVVGLGLAPGLLRAQQGPAEVVRSRNVAIERMLDGAGDSVSEATRERLKDVINGLMDFTELSKLSLGRHWEERTPADQQKFVAVFRQLVRNTSVRKVETYRADRIDYPPAVVTGTTARVTTVAHKGTKSVTIVYLMHYVGNEWKAFDVIIDGASTARNYRDSFSREIAKTSYAEMYAKLVQRADQP